MTKAPANPEILRWARTTLNLSLEEVGKRIGKSPDDVAAWESGDAEPTYVQLEELAYSVYKRPLALFFFPDIPAERGPREDFRTLPEFEVASLSSSVLKLVRRAQTMKLNLQELCGGKNPAARQILRDVVVTPSVRDSAASSKVREYLRIPLREQIAWATAGEAFSRWRDSLQAAGVFIFKEAFRQDGVSGFSLYDSEFPLIYVNNSMPSTRQVFTLFHELAHLMMSTGGIDKVTDDYLPALRGSSRRIEVFCNKFAAAFLVPDADFDGRAARALAREKDISDLAETYCVSREVVLRKLLDRGRVTQTQYDTFVEKWRKEAKPRRGKGGNYYANQRVYMGTAYLDLVFGAYYRRSIDAHQLADFLNMKVDKALALEASR